MELINRLAIAVKNCETVTVAAPVLVEYAWASGLCSDTVNHNPIRLRVTMQVYAGTQTYICDSCLNARHGFTGYACA